jgi:hypothetical protein
MSDNDTLLPTNGDSGSSRNNSKWRRIAIGLILIIVAMAVIGTIVIVRSKSNSDNSSKWTGTRERR